jgi:hypothetical protein
LTCLGPKRPKPAFDAYRYGIEEQVHGYEDYAYQLFTHLARRAPSATELRDWTRRFMALSRESRAGKSAFAIALLRENAPVVIRALYRQILGHDPTSDAVTYWADQMASGRSARELVLQLCASDEFWTLSGASAEGFVARVYRVLLGRELEASSRATLLAQLEQGLSREAVIASVLDGAEYQGAFIDAQFQALLGRAPRPAERARELDRMQHGLAREGLVLELVRTSEYWDAAIRAGYWRRMRSGARP